MIELFDGIRKTGTWAEIDLNAIGENFKSIKDTLDSETKICCVVKANAYGHGAIEIAKFLEKQTDVDYLSVARIEEGIELRNNGVKLPILCMGYTYVGDIDNAIKNEITLTIYNLEMAQRLNEYATRLDTKVRVHIKIDTGMSRLGFLVNDDSIEEIKRISKLDHLVLEGLYTHFAKADEKDKTSAYIQLSKFKYVVEKLEELNVRYKHISNSAGILDLKELGFNMVRLGVSLYGYYPSNEVLKDVKLKPALTIKTIITNVKKLPLNVGVSYGHVYKTDKEANIATLSIGYADGYPRSQVNPKVLVKNKLVDVVGRICMDQCMIEVPDDLVVNISDEVTVIGDVPGVTIDEVAERVNTISYEILCMVSRRVVRYYKISGVTMVRNYML